jgi:predicted nuclease with TOPRIM domain
MMIAWLGTVIIRALNRLLVLAGAEWKLERNQYDSLQRKIGKYMNRIQLLIARANTMIAVLAAMLVSIGSLRQKQAATSERFTKVEADVQRLKQQYNDALNGNIELSELEASFASLESEVVSLGSEIENSNVEIAALEQKAGEIDDLTPEPVEPTGETVPPSTEGETSGG